MAATRRSSSTRRRRPQWSGPRGLAGLYLLLQGLACYAWWGLIASDPYGFGTMFIPLLTIERFANEALIADLVMFGGVSILAGVLAIGGSRGRRAVACIALGGVGYATLLTYGMWREERATDLALAMMLASLAATALAVLALMRPRR
jgi:hypothetical protein